MHGKAMTTGQPRREMDDQDDVALVEFITRRAQKVGLVNIYAFAAATKEPFADYLGGGKGLMVRDDLGGLNMSTVPKVFIECGNMRNAHDAKALTNPAWRQDAARGIADGLTSFVENAPTGSG